jgi:hypothetical protein
MMKELNNRYLDEQHKEIVWLRKSLRKALFG